MIRTLSPSNLFKSPAAFRSLKSTQFGAPQVRLQRFYSEQKGHIQEIRDLKQFTQFIQNEKVSVIDFYATWCGPCKALEPIFDSLAEKVPEVQFGRVDVDEAQTIAGEYGITAMPTCLFFQDGEKVDTIIGANPPKLVQLIQKHAKLDLAGR